MAPADQATNERRADRMPNILVIVSDDHGYADRSATGIDPAVRTPGLDRLAAEGVTCREAYVTAPVCSPSRAGLIAGAYQQRWGAHWFDDSAIPGPGHPTVAERLRDHGYRTGYYGKVHYGREREGDRGTPPEHGFDDSFYGLAGQSMGRLNYLRHSEQAVQEYGEAARAMAVQPMSANGSPVDVERFLTDEIADRAAGFIAADDERPFFAMVAFNAVHNFCWQLPEDELETRGLPAFEDWYPGASEYLDWYDGAISPNLPNGREYYLAQLELMDRQVARLLDLLDELGLAEDTIVVYTTDNGGSNCNYGVNTPLRGSKYTVYEGGIRVPFLVRWSGELPAGVERDGLVSSMDIAATALAAAGAPVDGLDGRDLRGFLAGADGPVRDELHWDTRWQWSVRRDRWKLSWVEPGSPHADEIRRVEHTEPGDGYRLADLVADPEEREDASAANPEVVEALLEARKRWRDAMDRAAASVR
ncbi:sulfatase family protein [Agromyces marinus]|uniref:Arylsulfatase n=1 Tax=Agromyces marinus TaxID=1389020 RepID=A0ABN6YFE8_9MICO|nr:sulfatase-like hydrolase/transferase [Agromyces marinus]UIP57258.1 N-acetylgalactosamine-6-O-sulfatase [Agromyces marinus]BDZ54650.1 arylsulfatase [Agromyces marinus]